MKIDGNRLHHIAAQQQAERVQADRTAGPKTRQAADTAAPDRIDVSSDVNLVTAAVAAANQASDIRPDVVARARALIENGTLGADPQKLADAIITRTLDE